MPPMPNRPQLPDQPGLFGSEAPSGPSAEEPRFAPPPDMTLGDAMTPPDEREPAEAVPVPPQVAALRGRRPWWARLLGGLISPGLTLKIDPPAPREYVNPRPVC